jgi:hypothetical protein
LLAHCLEAEGKLLLDLPRDLGRHPDAARLRQLLQSCGNVDALAVTVVALDDDLAEVEPDPHLEALIVRHCSVAFRQAALQADRALDGIDDAAELGKQPIAHQLENAAVVPRNLRLEQFLSARHQPPMRARLVTLHQGGVADHIGSEDSGELSVHARSQRSATKRPQAKV